jgi:hypothetical protein
MLVSVSEMVINSNKRVRIKDCNELEDKVIISSIKSGSYKVLKREQVMLNNMSKLTLKELLK